MKKSASIALSVLVMALCVQGALFCQEETPMDRGLRLFYSTQFRECIPAFEEVLSQKPQNTLAISYIIDAYARLGERDVIFRQLEQKTLDSGGDPIALCYEGIGYLLRGMSEPSMLEEGRDQFVAALKTDDGLSIAYSGLGMVYFNKRIMSKAKGFFLKSLSINSEDIIALEGVGNILLVDEKKPEEALVYFTRINDILPNYPDAYYYVGSSYYDMRKWDEAIPYLKKNMEMDPNGLIQGYYSPGLLGDIYFYKEDFAEAEKYYQRCLEINPNNSYIKTKLEILRDPSKKGTYMKTKGGKPEEKEVKKEED